MHQVLLEHGFVSPKVAARRDELPRVAAFLVKPFDSGGGEGIELLHESWRPTARGCYFQERIAGVSCSAIFVGSEGGCRFLGGTRQLTGRASSDFAYAGSIGPYPFDDATFETLRRMGEVLQREFGLRGLFGVDFLLNEAGVWPVELNPRYTASVEVLELALGCSFIGEHARAFGTTELTEKLALPSWAYVGKRVLFASRSLVFPEISKTLSSSFDPVGFRELADIPSPGTEIGAGDPILTVFAHGATLIECDTRLQAILREWLQRLHQT
ncbi:ATP-grasp domain-containing protein [Singulisphaera sp. PoT]|uniref:ATP-grasp domain-containing protein n=1 Tax=Singulisphaera sp. PoT TaxID=3411797 RepID=UPI003BF5CC81